MAQKFVENGFGRLQFVMSLGEVGQFQAGPQLEAAAQQRNFAQNSSQQSRFARAVGADEGGRFSPLQL